MSDGLWCECRIPLAWRIAASDELARLDTLREASLLLTALNHMEGTHDLESSAGGEQRRLERLESKVDLALYLLARTLDQGLRAESRRVRLSPEDIEWQDDAPPREGDQVIIELRPSDALPLSLRLPAEARTPHEGWARARLSSISDPLNEALYQFVFRRHRQAIRARMG